MKKNNLTSTELVRKYYQNLVFNYAEYPTCDHWNYNYRSDEYKNSLIQWLKSNKEKPLQADTLNYLGFTTRKLGDYENGEKYYLLGLEINPSHVGINEYLGELYVATNRINLAKERLKVLESCNCEEYNELKEIIQGTKKSKY